jgi:hypothetical protein
MSSEATKIQQLTDEIEQNRLRNRVTHSVLQTSQRVLKRITDGIYRQPASALRELISNAYDADAKRVSIDLDAPSFERVTISDDGNGLTTKALASLIQSIGGSGKRTFRGFELGVSSEVDPTLSPGGRKLIGKIGIGIFSVAQLTREFQIITKTKGEKFRTIADIILETHTEDALQVPDSQDAMFKTGNVRIWTVDADDADSHGTQVVLRSLLPRTRDELANRDMWARIHHTEFDFDPSATPAEPPPYHIGYADPDNSGLLLSEPSLPWDPADNPVRRFEKLVQAVYEELGMTRNPSRAATFDNYLNTIWTLSLSAPLDYLDGHPFDIRGYDEIPVFLLGNPGLKGGRAELLDLAESETARQRLKLVSPQTQRGDTFEVIVDGVSLRRPLKFRNLPETDSHLKQPLMFVGKDSPDFSSIPENIRGGRLAFEAYFFWTPKVVPTEHRGVLLRINNASGSLFDETFLKYQVSEQTRLRQLTAEIFVTEGLDAALNIDRESFNISHPHYQYITTWVHNSLRLIASRQKALSKNLREQERADAAVREEGEFERMVRQILSDLYVAEEEIPPVAMVASEEEARERRKRESGAIILLRNTIFERLAQQGRAGPGARGRGMKQGQALGLGFSSVPSCLCG